MKYAKYNQQCGGPVLSYFHKTWRSGPLAICVTLTGIPIHLNDSLGTIQIWSNQRFMPPFLVLCRLKSNVSRNKPAKQMMISRSPRCLFRSIPVPNPTIGESPYRACINHPNHQRCSSRLTAVIMLLVFYGLEMTGQNNTRNSSDDGSELAWQLWWLFEARYRHCRYTCIERR